MTTHHFGDLADEVYGHYQGGWPWQVIGVFPTADQSEFEQNYSWFNYTVGLGLHELWVSCVSIEGRGMGNEVCCEILNVIGGAWQLGYVGFGEDIVVPLGIPNEDGEWDHDADSVWWLSTYWVPSHLKQVNMPGRAERTVPIIWSSPLGWPRDTGKEHER